MRISSALTSTLLLAIALPRAASADTRSDRIAAIDKAYDLAEWMTLVKPEETSHVEGISKKPQACLDAVAAMTAEGAADTDKIKISHGELTLATVRATCEQILVDATAFEKAVTDREGGNRAAIEAKYKKAGFKGDRYRLFVDNELNDGGFPWYAKGCEQEITDLKALAKAKKLFQWTAGANGGTLVTRYTFKGNKYKEVSREFFTEAKAYAFCK